MSSSQDQADSPELEVKLVDKLVYLLVFDLHAYLASVSVWQLDPLDRHHRPDPHALRIAWPCCSRGWPMP